MATSTGRRYSEDEYEYSRLVRGSFYDDLLGLSFRFTGHDDHLRRWLRQPGGHGHSAGGVEMK